MRSMTGCGRCECRSEAYAVTAELRTVNHRFLDVALRLPRNLAFLEPAVRTALAAELRRGHVEVWLSVTSLQEAARTVTVDTQAARAYLDAATQLAAIAGKAKPLRLSELMAFEGVLQVTETALDEEAVTALCREAVAGAAAQVAAMREKEGAALAADLTAHLDAVAALRDAAAERAPGVVAGYREALSKRLAQIDAVTVDPARLAQEVALMADKCAIDEELSRLLSHIAQLRTYIAADGEVGKKMDFLIQEMNREVNTIGSKANDAQLARLVVDAKSEIEKLREQIQNVE